MNCSEIQYVRDFVHLHQGPYTAFIEGSFKRLSYISIIVRCVRDATESDHICPFVCMEHLRPFFLL